MLQYHRLGWAKCKRTRDTREDGGISAVSVVSTLAEKIEATITRQLEVNAMNLRQSRNL
jgi:hypothetical protein